MDKQALETNFSRMHAMKALLPFTAELLEEIAREDYAGEQVAPGHISLADRDTGLLLSALFERTKEFQERVFPDQPVKSKLVHLSREVTELRANPDDRFEWADCLILLLGAASKQGLTIDDLLVAAHQKMGINNERQWGEPDADGVHHHIEEAQ